MNAAEVADLLSVVAACDRRTIGQTDVMAWLGIIGDLQLDECKRAVATHFATSTDYLMPVHIRRLVTVARQDTAMRQLPSSPHDVKAMPDWFRDEVDKHRKRSQEDRDSGKLTLFGEAIVSAFDRQPRPYRGPR